MASTAGASIKYASALHRRTHRVTSALAHAALEWTLIALLLINGLLSRAVARFAAYFGLSPPCLLCARVDRLFGAAHEDDDEAAGDARWLRGVLCGAHAAEISGMGYCLRHGRLVAEAADMCEGCLSSWNKKESRHGAGETTGVLLLQSSCGGNFFARYTSEGRSSCCTRQDSRRGGSSRCAMKDFCSRWCAPLSLNFGSPSMMHVEEKKEKLFVSIGLIKQVLIVVEIS
ncbi:myosin-binding protein 3-like [Lolium perenne]|uniref:myosin-binding protein 3-like n=1 Tax=Lolium perenne TaxID=4522 RepID=UPI003A9A5288